MSSATFSAGGFGSGSRRAAARRLVATTAVQQQSIAAAPASVPLPLREGLERASRWPSRPVLAVLAVLALHAGVIEYIRHRPADAVTPAAALQPVTVELAAPPVTEPPKPLPQKHLVTPPPPPPPPQTPHIDQPPPPPIQTPLPAITPQTPVVQAPPPAPAVPQPVAPPPPVPVTAAVGYAGYLNNPQPEYPQFAIDQGWEGRVLLAVHVLASGHPDHVNIKRTSGHKLLDELASRTVQQRWAFMPAHQGDTPVDGWVDVPIDFKLSN